MSILSVDTIQPIGSGSTVTVSAAKVVVGTGITFESNGQAIYAGIITATSFSGSGANLTSLPAQATIANNADNRVITGGSGVNLNGEANLTWNGTAMAVGHSNPNDTLHVYHATDNLVARFESGDTGGGITLKDNTHVTSLLTTNGAFEINVDQGGDISGETIAFKMSGSEKLRIDSYGVLRVGNTHSQVTSGNTKRIALGAKGSIFGWTSGNINGAITMSDNYYWDGSNNKAIENDYSAYLTLRSGNLRFGTTSQAHSAGGNISTGIHERFRIETNGNATINDGNLVIGTSGHGIDFHNYGSGTNISSNLLDDYEEGSAVPDFANADNSIVTVNRYTYTKVGRLVHFEAKFTVGSNNDGSGFGFTLPVAQGGSRETVIPAISTRSGSTTTPFAFVVNANQSYAYAKALDGFSATHCEYLDFAGDIILVSGTYEST